MLEKVDASNRQETVKTLQDLTVWYRDLLDEELIRAWQRGGRANLTEVLEKLADRRVAAGIVEFSWRQERQATFTLAYSPILGHLMLRYPESARPFLDDLAAPAAKGGPMPYLLASEAEAVCTILMDMPDLGTWRQDALTILPYYRAAAESLLNRDLGIDDKKKSSAAQFWRTAIEKAPSSSTQHAQQGNPTGTPANSSAPDSRSLPATGTDGDDIKVLSGTYGQNCGQPKGNKTEHLAQACNGRKECSYVVDYTILGDPAPGCRKDYIAEWECGGGPLRALAEPEAGLGSSIRLSCALPGVTPLPASAPVSTPAPAGPGTMGPDGLYRIGNGVSKPNAITRVGAEYSEVARKLRPLGRSVVQFVIQPDGTARDFKVLVPVGYGLDEKLIEAVRQWRFSPALKDGVAVPVLGSAEHSYGDTKGTEWLSGPMNFVPQAGVTPPVVIDGTMPKPGQEISNETAVLGFTVDDKGNIRNIHAISGSQPASDLLSHSLATWKFQPAMRGNLSVEATGTVRFVKGRGDESSNRPMSESSRPGPATARGTVNSATTLTAEMLEGVYRRDPVKNPWHRGRIDTDPLRWTNDAGVSWRLTPDLANGRLLTGPDDPYYKTAGTQEFHIVLSRGPDGNELPNVEGIQFGELPNEFYRRENARPIGSSGQIRTFTSEKDGQTYVWIPPGTFTMGCSDGDTECGGNEKPSHAEEIAKGFWIGQTEVTQAAYRRVTGGNPSTHKGDQFPVESVTWNEAVNYCAAIGGRLPKESEWEYAARGAAGIAAPRYGTLDEVAWYLGNSGNTAQPVAQKQPNAFGLYDMLGNVWEFVQDAQPGSPTKTLRGGSWAVDPQNARATAIASGAPPARFNGRGFRCALGASLPVASGAVRESSAGFAGVVWRVGGGVTGPQVLHIVEPDYSEKARKAKYSGTVLVSAVVDTNGKAQDIHVARSLGMGLDEKAIEAVKKWKFKPGMKDGQPVNVRVTIEVNFRLI